MLEVVQVVRRFGKSGGMERYVWELSHALANQDMKVHILSEEITHLTSHKNIKIHLVKKVAKKPRWLAMLRFSRHVKHWVDNNSSHDWIIHSHERTSVHHVTTFHGPPFAHIKNKPFWKRISLRVLVWNYLEKRELCSNQVKVVLPNSDLILNDLKYFYPCVKGRIFPPAYPGSEDSNFKLTDLNDRKNIVLFIGKEWKRKGLEFSIEILEKMRSKDESIEFWVLGPETQKVEHLFKNFKGGYKLLGWDDPKNYLPKARLLIHPAISEPYGMVISEASSFGVPVVISNNCGIANLVTTNSGRVLSLEDNINDWIEACNLEIKRKNFAHKIGKSWRELALDHIKIYESFKEL